MRTLLAAQPTPTYAAEIEQFGRLVGLWKIRITQYSPDGSAPRHADGDWEFGYALEGRAVIDVWRVPSRAALAGAPRAAGQECGLCVRIWDPRLQLWRFTFHGTAHGDQVQMLARQIADEMVMERAEDGRLIRWIFADISKGSFSWRSETSCDGGRTWRLDQQVHATREVPKAKRA
ncbi:MAG TPA: hypothetical protein VGJ53_17455 [Micromonosporaceae bacterium]|jgi:hypothetical protein